MAAFFGACVSLSAATTPNSDSALPSPWGVTQGQGMVRHETDARTALPASFPKALRTAVRIEGLGSAATPSTRRTIADALAQIRGHTKSRTKVLSEPPFPKVLEAVSRVCEPTLLGILRRGTIWPLPAFPLAIPSEDRPIVSPPTPTIPPKGGPTLPSNPRAPHDPEAQINAPGSSDWVWLFLSTSGLAVGVLALALLVRARRLGRLD